MNLTSIIRSKCLVVGILCLNFHIFLSGQSIYPTDGNHSVGENYPTISIRESIDITLPTISLDTIATLSAWELNSSSLLRPQKGTPSSWNTQTFTYTPTDYQEGTDTITWKALRSDTLNYETYKFNIEIIGVNNPPEIQNTDVPIALTFLENQNYVTKITVFDPDSVPGNSANDLNFEFTGADKDYFASTYTGTSSTNDKMHEYEIRYAITSSPNFETLRTSYSLDLNVSDSNTTGVVNQLPLRSITVEMTDVDENPELTVASSSISRTIFEDEDTSQIPGFVPITLSAADPEGQTVRWYYTTNNTVIGGQVKISTAGGGEATLATGDYTSYFTSGEIVTVNYVPSTNSFGTEVLKFRAQDFTGKTSDYVTLTIDVSIQYDDPISLNEPTQVNVNFTEESTGVVYDFNPTDPDTNADANSLEDNNGSDPGAQLYYTLSGPDAHLFVTPTQDGKLYFKTAPDYETPLDSGGVLNDNTYELTVNVRDSQNVPYNEDEQIVSVTVDPLNELPVLNGGVSSEVITVDEDSEWVWSQSVLTLIASDVDAGDEVGLTWQVNPSYSGNYGTATITGTGTEPTSFKYVPDADYDGDGNSSTYDDTFRIQVYDGTGYTEVIFNVTIVPTSDPPLLYSINPFPIENISRLTERYTIYVSENNPSTVRLEFQEVDGDGIGNVEILNSSPDKNKFLPSPYWTSGDFFADFNFSSSHLPDFENNASTNGDGNYSITVRVSDDNPTPAYTDIHLDFIIQNVDDTPSLENPDLAPFVQENQTFVANLDASDPEGVTNLYWRIPNTNDYTIFELDINRTTPTSSNVLRFKSSPDYENPTDGSLYGDKNNTYVVDVEVSDAPFGSGTSKTQTFTVTVEDDNDAPLFQPITPLFIQVNETELTNSDMNLSQYIFDEDNLAGTGGDQLIWQKVSGDTGAFSLGAATGVLSFTNLSYSDFEYQSEYNLEVRVDDQRGGVIDRNFTIQLLDTNEPPQFFENNQSNTQVTFLKFDLDEDTFYEDSLSNYVRDPEASVGAVSISYTRDQSIDLNGTLTLGQNSGYFKYEPNPNYKGITYLTITATDGDLSNPQPANLLIEFHVKDVSDAPVVREGNNPSLISGYVAKVMAENDASWSMELNASDMYDDPPADNLFWTLSGSDASKFKISPSEGNETTLTLRSPPNYEAPNDADTDYTYDVTIHITDSDTSASSFDLELTYNDVDEPAIFDYGDGNTSVTYKDAGSFDEVTLHTSFFTVQARDIDVAPSGFESDIIYGLTTFDPGNNDNNSSIFSIDSVTGRISIISDKLDFENGQGTVSDDNNTYVLEVNATADPSDSNQIRHLVYLSVTNVIEPPQFDQGSSDAITSAENALGLHTFLVSSEEGNGSVELEISGGLDSHLFSLNKATNEISFITAPDYEIPTDNDTDNTYDVQVQIVGSNVTQDFEITVTSANDAPVIENTGLTQVIVDENTGFVIDIDVTDQDSATHRFDLLYHTSDNEVRYFAHSGDDSSIDNSYTSGVWTDINNLNSPSSIIHGDFNNDGFQDVILIEKSNNQIRYLQYDSVTSSFVEQSSAFARAPVVPTINSGTQPEYALANDLDQDGDLDLVVSFVGDTPNHISWFENNGDNGSGGVEFLSQALVYSSAFGNSSVGQEFVHFSIGDLDGDSYNDIVLAHRTGQTGRVSVLLNNGNNAFVYNHQFMEDLGITKPNFIELADMDNSGTLDILVSGEDAITLLYNNGMGTDDLLSVTSKNIGQFDGDGFEVLAYDFTLDGLKDLIYTTGDFNSGDGIRSRVKVLVQDTTGNFAEPSSLLPLHSDSNKALYRPEQIKVLPATSTTNTCIIFTDGATGYLSLYETRSTNDGTFENPVILAGTVNPESGSTVESIALVDLVGNSETFTYSLSGGNDLSEFDSSRFADDGKLYFKNLPDHENPTDDGTDNFYEVIVKVQDANGGESTKKVTVYVRNINDDPVIYSTSNYGTSPNGSWAFPLSLQENTIGEIANISASNDETDQNVSFSISSGMDASFFNIDEFNGSLTFKSPPDFETKLDYGANDTYEVIVRASDNGTNPGYDEQNITITITDGPEPPSFDSNTSTTYQIEEDTILWSPKIFATDDAGNPTVGFPTSPYSISVNASNGSASFDTNASFSYKPDPDFYGTDTFTIKVENLSSMETELEITVDVTSVNDPPSLSSASIIDVSESQQDVGQLSATDDSGGSLIWGWSDPSFSDSVFELSSSGELKFRNPDGIDFEDVNQKIEAFQPSDAGKLVLWLDADDNSTLFAFNAADNMTMATTTVGRWADKSGLENNATQWTLAEKPSIASASINGLDTVDFSTAGTNLLISNRLGLDIDPDILIFAVTQINLKPFSNNEKILSVGTYQTPNLTVSGGSSGWAWRFDNSTTEIYNSVDENTTGLQVWERSAGTGYSSSKFYHNGQEQTKTISGSNGSPSGNGTWTEIGTNLSGKIGELIVLNSTDSDDRQKLEGYLAHKWDLTSSLPVSHPFKYTLPAHVKWERSIRITDQDGGSTDSDLTIRVVNNNDNAPVINNSQLQGTNRILHNESTIDSPGSYLVIDLNVTDVDGDKLEYKLVGGADKSRFLELNMSASSVLAFGSSDPTFPSYDSADDLNGDNIYEVEIEVTDGNPSHAISLALEVEIVRPYFVVDGKELTDGTIDLTGSKGVYENNSSVIYLGKSDLWDNNVTYTTDGGLGVSQDLFEINATTNLLRFISPPDYESPLGVNDAQGTPTNTYEVEVVAIDELGYRSILDVSVDVLPINEPPGLVSDTFTLVEDTSWSGAMEISDPEDPSSKTYPFTVTIPPQNGTFVDNSDGTYKYQPNQNFFGTDQMVISVEDIQLTEDFTVTFEVTPVEDNPLAEDDVFTYKVSLGTSLDLDVLANDSNFPDSDDSDGIVIVSVDPASHGKVSRYDGYVKYTPSSTFLGLDSFQYTIQDAVGNESTATVEIVVHEVDVLPNWKYLKNMGFYNITSNNWIYQSDLGWIYLLDPSKIESVTWIWHQDIGWFWTGDLYAPDAYFNDFSSWFTFSAKKGSTALSWPIYYQVKEEWLDEAGFVDKQNDLLREKIRNEIAELTSGDDLIVYVENSTFFTEEQKNVIEFEVRFYGLSKTLYLLIAE